MVTNVSTLHRDALGSVRAVTNAAGLKAERSLFRPFGDEASTRFDLATAVESEGRRAIGPSSAPNGFIGQRMDADAGLQYLKARYYDPKLAMFIQPDWWEVTTAEANRYGYCLGDPVNCADTSGHVPDNWPTKGKPVAYDSSKKGATIYTTSGATKPDIRLVGNCSSKCNMIVVTGAVGKFLPISTKTIGTYSTRTASGNDSVGQRRSTSNVITGMWNYLFGGGASGEEPIRGIGGIDRKVAKTVLESAIGIGKSMTIRDAINGGMTRVNISVGISSDWADLTSGAIALSGTASSLTLNGGNGSLKAKSEMFDFNSNANRGAILDIAVSIVGGLAYVVSLGNAQPFEQNYTGSVEFTFKIGTE